MCSLEDQEGDRRMSVVDIEKVGEGEGGERASVYVQSRSR